MLLKYDSDVILGNNNTYVTNERYSINITELTPFTTYYFVIWANNSVGNTSTDMMNFTTDQTGTGMQHIVFLCLQNTYLAPRVAPDNFEVINITSNNITFTWDALVNGANGIIQQYVITCESNITIIVSIHKQRGCARFSFTISKFLNIEISHKNSFQPFFASTKLLEYNIVFTRFTTLT